MIKSSSGPGANMRCVSLFTPHTSHFLWIVSIFTMKAQSPLVLDFDSRLLNDEVIKCLKVHIVSFNIAVLQQ